MNCGPLMMVVTATTNASLDSKLCILAGSKMLCATTVRILSALPRELRAHALRWTTSAVMAIKEQNKEGLARRSTRATKIGTRPSKTCRHKASKMKNAKSMAFMKFPKGIGKCQATFAMVASNLAPKRLSATWADI